MQISPTMGIGSISTIISSNRTIKHFILAIEATRFMERMKPVKERMPYSNPFQKESYEQITAAGLVFTEFMCTVLLLSGTFINSCSLL